MPAPAFTRTPTARERRADVILAAVMFVGAVLSAGLSSIAEIYGDEQAPLWWALVYAVVATAPLAFRRRWPGTAAVIVAVAYFTAVTIRVPEIYVGNIVMFLTLYTVGAWMNDRRRAMLVRVGIIVGMFVWLIITMYRDAISEADKADVAAGAMSPYVAFMLIQLLLNVLYFGGAYYFGERSWAAAAQLAVLEQRTVELEREREVTAAQAVALDRVRIARELHDVVAHHVSVMGVQASAGRRVLDKDPVKARAALTAVEQSARTAVDELRRMLSLLRHSDVTAVPTEPAGLTEPAEPALPAATDPALSTAAGIDRVEDLVTSAREAGLEATVGVFGEPVPLPESLSQTAYRIVQEAITNTLKHAAASGIDVRIRYLATELELDIADDGRGPASAAPINTAGMGLIGMRERVAAHDGVLETGPRATGGGFRVRARFPLAQTVRQA
jgi:signal transduction histidine kinase